MSRSVQQVFVSGPQEALRIMSRLAHRFRRRSSIRVRKLQPIWCGCPKHFVGEAKSLELIEKAAPGLAPLVFRVGTILCKDEEEGETPQETQFMISEYKFLQPLRGEDALLLARRLALELHAYKSERGQDIAFQKSANRMLTPSGYGFECATYCGATRTQGAFFDTWAACFADMITSLLSNLRTKSQYSELIKLGDEIVST